MTPSQSQVFYHLRRWAERMHLDAGAGKTNPLLYKKFSL